MLSQDKYEVQWDYNGVCLFGTQAREAAIPKPPQCVPGLMHGGGVSNT